MTTQLCTFRLGELFCGIAVLDVQEVLLQRELTPVPLAPPSVKGLMNLRGEVLPAIDLRMVLGLGATEALDVAHVIVRMNDYAASLIVDAVEDVITVTSTTYEAPPPTVSGVARDYITGVHKLDGRLLLVLDAHRIIEPERL